MARRIFTSEAVQRAYEISLVPAGGGVQERLYASMYVYTRNTLGLPEDVCRTRAEAEVANRIGTRFCDACEARGISLAGKVMLDLGAGLGGVATAAVERGANVIALEPGSAWRSITAERLASVEGTCVVLGAVGEQLPVASSSVDLVSSVQVLEHVQNPKAVVEEAFRILKPGGQFILVYENYLSFFEPHYQVRWLPLLPKSIGAWYLRKLGRDPSFLQEAVTYTTFPSVRRYLASAGFICTRSDEYRAGLADPAKSGLKWKLLKRLSAIDSALALRLLSGQDFVRRMFKTAVHEVVRKPA